MITDYKQVYLQWPVCDSCPNRNHSVHRAHWTANPNLGDALRDFPEVKRGHIKLGKYFPDLLHVVFFLLSFFLCSTRHALGWGLSGALGIR